MRYFKQCSALLLTLLIAAYVQGCATTGEGGGGQINMLSVAQEKEIGAELSAEVEKNEKVLDDPSIQQYIKEIGQRIARVSPRQDVDYVFTVIEKDEVNAFALPGGHMYIYTGLLKLCQNEAELASVMGHEIGHVASHHHGEQLTRQYGIEMIAGVLLGSDPKQAQQVATQIGAQLGSLYFSREQERESDRVGMDMLFRAGYNPEAMVTFMQRMLAQEQSQGGGSRQFGFLSSHPLTANRIALLQELVAQYPDNMRQQGTLGADDYKATVLNRLAN